jgi:hypothetical protein
MKKLFTYLFGWLKPRPKRTPIRTTSQVLNDLKKQISDAAAFYQTECETTEDKMEELIFRCREAGIIQASILIEQAHIKHLEELATQ